jgi:hypothetical protein
MQWQIKGLGCFGAFTLPTISTFNDFVGINVIPCFIVPLHTAIAMPDMLYADLATPFLLVELLALLATWSFFYDRA